MLNPKAFFGRYSCASGAILMLLVSACSGESAGRPGSEVPPLQKGNDEKLQANSPSGSGEKNVSSGVDTAQEGTTAAKRGVLAKPRVGQEAYAGIIGHLIGFKASKGTADGTVSVPILDGDRKFFAPYCLESGRYTQGDKPDGVSLSVRSVLSRDAIDRQNAKRTGTLYSPLPFFETLPGRPFQIASVERDLTSRRTLYRLTLADDEGRISDDSFEIEFRCDVFPFQGWAGYTLSGLQFKDETAVAYYISRAFSVSSSSLTGYDYVTDREKPATRKSTGLHVVSRLQEPLRFSFSKPLTLPMRSPGETAVLCPTSATIPEKSSLTYQGTPRTENFEVEPGVVYEAFEYDFKASVFRLRPLGTTGEANFTLSVSRTADPLPLEQGREERWESRMRTSLSNCPAITLK